MAEKKQIDWDLIERDWRAGIKTKAQMSAEHGVSRQAMDKRFNKMGITRNLADKIRTKAASMVERAIVEAEPLSPATEREIVDANAAMQSDIILAHRKDIQRTRRLAMKLMDELEVQTDNADLMEELRDALYDPEDKGMQKRLEAFDKLMSLGSRAGTMRTLAETMRTLIGMERQAFGLDDKDDDSKGNQGVEDVIAHVMAENGEG